MREQFRPTTQQLKEELSREQKKKKYGKTLRGTIYSLLTVAAVAVLIATLLVPVLQVTGTSMEPTLESGEIVLAVKNSDFHQGDIIAFYYNNAILLKRVVAFAGDQVEIKKDGTVYVNGRELNEPYLSNKSFGQCDLTFPYQVPDGKVFVLGDHRATALDSRSSSVGCIADKYVVGKVVFRVWPLNKIELIRNS